MKEDEKIEFVDTSINLSFWIIWVLFFLSCSGQIPEEVPYHRNPHTPSLSDLQAVSKVEASELVSQMLFDEKGHGINIFFKEDSLYSGWAYQLFPDTDHRYRFTLYQQGHSLWQIGYYDNGQIDHDFHQKNDKSMGSERMWNKDGSLYIDYFYSAPGKMDGIQQRWHGNGILAREAVYTKGEMVYEVLFDEEGNVVERKGEVPEHK